VYAAFAGDSGRDVRLSGKEHARGFAIAKQLQWLCNGALHYCTVHHSHLNILTHTYIFPCMRA
jgi:hypothetical protein